MTKKINEHYFDRRERTIEEKIAMYYVLGAWYSSGSSIESTYDKKDVTSTYRGIQFKNRSKKLVQIVKSELQAQSTITSDKSIRKECPKKRHSHWFTKYGTPTLCDRLEELGVAAPEDQREFPDIPIKYLRHFVRGYFDAAVSIYRINGKTEIHIPGSPKFQAGLKKVLKKYAHAGECGRIGENLKYTYKDVAKICNFIYKEEGFYLPYKKRKLEKAQTELQYVGKNIQRRIKRIENAKKVLEKGGTDDEAASAAKYAHTTGLYIPFRKTTGMTPGQYSKKYAGKGRKSA